MKKALVTGSCGLVGSGAVDFLCQKKFQVLGIDNNLRAYLFGEDAATIKEGIKLKEKYKNFSLLSIDIRESDEVKKIFQDYGPFDLIIHAAAQPSHEWSTNNALEDFQINAWGTIVMLENLRKFSPKAVFIQVSSSKVYGDSVNDLPLVEYKTRFDLPRGHPFWEGINEEDMRLDGDLHSLFGASKACGDLMAHEYGTYFNLKIAIFRPVCITGSTHKGAKLHGYLSYLVKCISTSQKYIINGYSGKQVRDNIHANDLVRAFWEVYKNPKYSYGEAYNIGGGRISNNSILEAIAQAEGILNRKSIVEYSNINRLGDHKWCIYSSKKFKSRYPNWKIEFDNDKIMADLCSIYL